MAKRKGAASKPQASASQPGLAALLRRHEWLAPVVASMLVAALTFGWAATLYRRPPLLHDALGYTTTALRLLDRHVFAYGGQLGDSTPPNAAITPGYALFLTGIYGLAPRSADSTSTILAVQPTVTGLQFVLALVLVGLVAACGFTLGGRWLAYLSGFLAALYPPFAWSSTVALSECLGATLLTLQLLLALLLTRKDAERRAGLAVALGGVSAVLAFVRPVTAPWIVVPLLFLVARRVLSWREVGRVAAVALIAFVVVMSPWWIRNAVTMHAFIPLSTGAGDPAFVSTGGYPLTTDEQAVFDAADAKGQDAEGAVAYYRMGNQLRNDPLGFFAGRFRSAEIAVLSPWSVPRDAMWEQIYEPTISHVGDNAFDVPQPSPSLVFAAVFAVYVQWTALVLAVASLLFVRRWPQLLLVISLPVYFILAHSTTYFIDRYFFPVMPAVFVAAAAALWGVALNARRLVARLRASRA